MRAIEGSVRNTTSIIPIPPQQTETLTALKEVRSNQGFLWPEPSVLIKLESNSQQRVNDKSVEWRSQRASCFHMFDSANGHRSKVCRQTLTCL